MKLKILGKGRLSPNRCHWIAKVKNHNLNVTEFLYPAFSRNFKFHHRDPNVQPWDATTVDKSLPLIWMIETQNLIFQTFHSI